MLKPSSHLYYNSTDHFMSVYMRSCKISQIVNQLLDILHILKNRNYNFTFTQSIQTTSSATLPRAQQPHSDSTCPSSSNSLQQFSQKLNGELLEGARQHGHKVGGGGGEDSMRFFIWRSHVGQRAVLVSV